MRLFSILFIAAGAAAAATTYTATNLQPANSPYHVANVYGLNNHGQVLVDICANGCTGANRLLGVWSNGVITPLPFPAGYSYSPNGIFYHINDSGTVVGAGAWVFPNGSAGGSVVVWTNGVPAVLPNAPYSSGFGGEGGCPSSANGSSAPYGINAAGHIVGTTTYNNGGGSPPCSAFWVYDGSTFRVLPIPIPSQCTGLPRGYYPGVNVYNPLTINDADQALGTLQNVFCAPPYITPGWAPRTDPFVVRTNGNSSFLPLGSLSGASGTRVNDAGDVLGYYGVGGSGAGGLVFWDKSGVHDLGVGSNGYMNQVGQLVYLTTPCVQCGGGIAMWQNGVSTPVQLPSGVTGVLGPGAMNDAGQIVVGTDGGPYLLSPTGPCGQDVTSQVQISRGGFRLNHTTGHFTQTVTLMNTSGASIAGPISLALDNLGANASLLGINGATLCEAPQGSPYVNLAAASLDPGAAVTATVEFIDTANTGIAYSLRVLAGPGGR